MKSLIDSDSIIFSCGFVVEHNYYLVYDMDAVESPEKVFTSKRELNRYIEYLPDRAVQVITEIEPLENALHLVKQKIQAILDYTGAKEYSIYIKGKGNFRDEIARTRPYKGNRDLEHRPVYEQEIREYLIERWGAELVDNIEVDDKVAMEQWKDHMAYLATGLGPTTIICSPDKDLDQIPGVHYNYNTMEKYWINEEEATRNLYIQILAGDSSDNIIGCPKIGRKTAEKLLRGCFTEKDMYSVCKKEYRKAYGEKAEEVMQEMANLVYLKRVEGDSWSPPSG